MGYIISIEPIEEGAPFRYGRVPEDLTTAKLWAENIYRIGRENNTVHTVAIIVECPVLLGVFDGEWSMTNAGLRYES